jgi:biopolymer transport protein ExbB
MDPRSAYRQCQNYPSPAANIIRTMLLKVGRPHSEVERAVAEASEREANRMYANVRWLNLVAAVTPLLGLLGTVWGMIRAFFDTTQLAIGQNKADYLAAGIYVALVTTLGGLAVAIPAAIFAHFFEGRIQRIIYQIDEMLFNLLPHIERYEGRMRLNTSGVLEEDLYGVSADGASNREKPLVAGGQVLPASPGNAAAKTGAPAVFDPPTSPTPPRQRRSTPS